MICHDKGSHNHAANVLTIFQQEYECVLERNTSVVTEFTKILLWVSEKSNRRIVSELVDGLADISFETNFISGISKALDTPKKSHQEEQLRLLMMTDFIE